MGISYLFLDPPRRQAGEDAPPGDGLPPTFLSNARALGPIRYAFANDPAPIFTDPSLPPEQREATRAAEQFRRGFAAAWNKYSGLGLQDAVDGYADFGQALDDHRAKALQSVSPAAQQILKPALDRLHFECTEIGLAHWQHHNQAVNAQIDAARAERAEADKQSAQALIGDLHEAHHVYDDPAQLQTVAERGDETWLQIAQRNGWNQQQFDQQRAQWNEKLYGVAIARHLDDGDVPGAKAVLANAHQRLDPATFGRLSGTIDAGARHIEQRDLASAGQDTIVDSPDQVVLYGGAGKDAINGDDDTIQVAVNADGSGADGSSVPASAPVGARAADVARQGIYAARDNYKASALRYFSAEAGRGYHGSFVGRALDQIILPPTAVQKLDAAKTKQIYGLLINTKREPGQIVDFPWPIDVRQGFASYLANLPEDQRKAKQAQIEQTLRAMGVEFLTEEEWNNDPDLRRNMPFEPFMTRERALAKAQLFDDAQEREYQIGHAPDDPFLRAAGKALGFVSDPLNVVPAGMAAKQLYNVARLLPTVARAIVSGEALNIAKTEGAKIVANSLKGALIGGGTTAIGDTLKKPLQEKMGEDAPWSGIGLNALQSAGMGVLFGIAGGVGSRIARSPAGGGGGGSAAMPPAARSVVRTKDAALTGEPVSAPLPRLFHYTNENGLAGILASQKLRPSLKAVNPNDARHGNGQYLTDIIPGSMTPSKLSQIFLGFPFQGRKFTHFVEIDPSGLSILRGRENVFVVPNEVPLDLSGRIIGHGAH